MPYDCSIGLVPDHLGFRKPRRRADIDAAEPVREVIAPETRPPRFIPQPSPEQGAAGASAPLADAHQPRDEDAAGETEITVMPLRHEPGAADSAGNQAAPLSAASATAGSAPPNPPADAHSLDAHRIERLLWRNACNWLALYRICRRTRCRHAGRCRGEPMACLQAGAAGVPQPVRDFVLHMMKAQELGLSFEEAFADAGEDFDAYEAWVCGLAAAGAADVR